MVAPYSCLTVVVLCVAMAAVTQDCFVTGEISQPCKVFCKMTCSVDCMRTVLSSACTMSVSIYLLILHGSWGSLVLRTSSPCRHFHFCLHFEGLNLTQGIHLLPSLVLNYLIRQQLLKVLTIVFLLYGILLGLRTMVLWMHVDMWKCLAYLVL